MLLITKICHFRNDETILKTFQPLIRTIQNKVFWKVKLGLDEPNMKAIEENSAAFRNAENFFLSQYLMKNDFVGGSGVNVCDLIASATFEQVL